MTTFRNETAAGHAVPADGDPVISPRETALYLGVSESWLAKRRCFKDGGPDWLKLGPKKIGYRISALHRFLQACRRTPHVQEKVQP